MVLEKRKRKRPNIYAHNILYRCKVTGAHTDLKITKNILLYKHSTSYVYRIQYTYVPRLRCTHMTDDIKGL